MKTTSLRILHTSDWHIGRTLYGRRRYETFSAFLDWLEHNCAPGRFAPLNIPLVMGALGMEGIISNISREILPRYLLPPYRRGGGQS